MRMRVPALLMLLCAMPAAAQRVDNPGGGASSSKPVLLYSNGILAGTGADTTEDTMMSVTLPANTLVNVGDTLHVVVRGVAAANTDVKTTRIKFGPGQTIAITQNSATTTLAYYMESWITVTAVNAQTTASFAQNGTVASSSASSSVNLNMAAPITIALTGQNATNGTANSVQANLMLVELFPGS